MAWRRKNNRARQNLLDAQAICRRVLQGTREKGKEASVVVLPVAKRRLPRDSAAAAG